MQSIEARKHSRRHRRCCTAIVQKVVPCGRQGQGRWCASVGGINGRKEDGAKDTFPKGKWQGVAATCGVVPVAYATYSRPAISNASRGWSHRRATISNCSRVELWWCVLTFFLDVLFQEISNFETLQVHLTPKKINTTRGLIRAQLPCRLIGLQACLPVLARLSRVNSDTRVQHT